MNMNTKTLDLNLIKQVWKERGLQDLFFFNKEILGFKDMTERTHEETCQMVHSSGDRKILLLPRDTFKTSTVTIGHTLQKIAQDPNIRVLIDSEVRPKAVKFLGVIKNFIEGTFNPRYHQIYGIRKKEPGWQTEEITIANRTVDHKEPTVSTAGVDVTKTGFHYDLIICDDLHSEKNVTSREQIEKVIYHYKIVLSLLDPNGTLIIIGTRWHDRDLYQHILDHEKDFQIIIKKAIQDDGSLFFPERLSKRYLARKRASQGSHLYSMQYQNEVVDDETAVFKKSQIKYYKDLPERLNVYTTVDLAEWEDELSISPERKSYTVILTGGVDVRNNLYWLEYIRRRINPSEVIEEIFRVYARRHPMRVGIETVLFQRIYTFHLKEEMRKRNVFFSITEFRRTGGKSKDDRILRLQPRYEAGTVFQKEDMVELEDELIRFPRGKTKDILDAGADMLELIIPPSELKPKLTPREKRYKKLTKPKVDEEEYEGPLYETEEED